MQDDKDGVARPEREYGVSLITHGERYNDIHTFVFAPQVGVKQDLPVWRSEAKPAVRWASFYYYCIGGLLCLSFFDISY